MGFFHRYGFGIDTNPPLPTGTKVSVSINPLLLASLGLNIPVEISTASVFRKFPNPLPLASITVAAHFDTGASITSIDLNLAKHLHLVSIGQTTRGTAAGPIKTPDYAIDLSFPNTNLSPFFNLKIGSCDLGFNPANINPNIPQNFGILLGRDIMSKWNIVWNGPTSTVFISD
jgi:hypothetical protein